MNEFESVVSRSRQKGVVKVNSQSVVLGTWQTARVDVLSLIAQTCRGRKAGDACSE